MKADYAWTAQIQTEDEIVKREARMVKENEDKQTMLKRPTAQIQHRRRNCHQRVGNKGTEEQIFASDVVQRV